MTVYIDEVFFVNLFMDWLLLWITANMTCSTDKMVWRKGIAACLGALYSILIFIPGYAWLATLPGKLGCSILMVWIAFGFQGWKPYGKQLIYFYLISFLFGGATLAITYVFGKPWIQTWNGIALVEMNFHFVWLALAVFGIMVVVFFLRQTIRRDLEQAATYVTAEIVLEHRSARVSLFVDTGNHLVDPVTARPVIIVEPTALCSLFPKDIVSSVLEHRFDNAKCMILFSEKTEFGGRLRLIPYQTIGEQKLLFGFRSDIVSIQSSKRTRIHKNVVVVFSQQILSVQGEYQGLISPELL